MHHLTYRHAKREFLFELVAVCQSCHSRLHEDNAPDGNSGSDPESDYSDEIDLAWIDHPCDGCRYAGEENGEFHCSAVDKPAMEARASLGECGPDQQLFEELR